MELMKTANFTLHFWGLFILGLPMETVNGVQLVLRQTCGWHVHGIYSIGYVTEYYTFLLLEVSQSGSSFF